MFHAGGVYCTFGGSIYWDMQFALYTTKPVNSMGIMEAVKYSGSRAMVVPPSSVAELSNMDNGMELLMKMTFIGYGGGESCLCRDRSAVPPPGK
jgi:hypothetical protein